MFTIHMHCVIKHFIFFSQHINVNTIIFATIQYQRSQITKKKRRKKKQYYSYYGDN